MEGLVDARFIGALGLMVLLTISPGPDMALVTTTSLLHGRAAAIRTSLGISSGTLIWATLAGLGVAALLAASAETFAVIRLLGAAYLVYLGVRALLEAFRGPVPDGAASDPVPTTVARRPYRQGLLTNLFNPKVGLFYTTLVPQLVDPGDPIALVSIAVGAAHATIGLVWLVVLAVVVDRLGDVLRRPRIRRALAGATGTILVAFGLRVAVEPT
jgi:threonine/homoserine/homoserine lactone efflux protein